MTQREFGQWIDFYRRHPFDDMHRYHRPAAMVARSIGGADINQLLDWLQPPFQAGEYSEADMNTMRAFGFKPPKG